MNRALAILLGLALVYFAIGAAIFFYVGHQRRSAVDPAVIYAWPIALALSGGVR